MLKKFLFAALLAVGAFANSLSVGSDVSNVTIKDQFEKSNTISAETKTILFASDKDMSDILKEYLLSKEGDILTKNNAIYVADISGMPSLISKFIALPKMKKYPFSVMLLDDSNKELFAKEEGKIIVYTLADSKVSEMKTISTVKELEEIIK
ncbi:MAG: hypothetical protein KA073_00025 [Aliarcobacter sp.]|nr:hypothetical protein [Aliarcobacter sp.]